MTEQEKQAYIDEIRKRLEMTTSGQWEQAVDFVIVKRSDKHTHEIADCGTTYDAEFISHSRNDIPCLLNALDATKREVELKESEYQATINKLNKQTKLIRGYQDSLKIYIEENQSFRKALEEIADYDKQHTVKATAIFDVAKVARQALSGEEK